MSRYYKLYQIFLAEYNRPKHSTYIYKPVIKEPIISRIDGDQRLDNWNELPKDIKIWPKEYIYKNFVEIKPDILIKG